MAVYDVVLSSDSTAIQNACSWVIIETQSSLSKYGIDFKQVLFSISFSVPLCKKPTWGSIRSTNSPLSCTTNLKTPCAAGCCGPKLSVNDLIFLSLKEYKLKGGCQKLNVVDLIVVMVPLGFVTQFTYFQLYKRYILNLTFLMSSGE